MLAAPLLVRWGFRRTATIGTLFVLLGFAGLVTVSLTDSPRWVLTASLALSGLGFGPTSMSYLLGAQDAVQWQQRGIITSSITLTRTMGGALGISALGALFNLIIHPDLQKLEAQGFGAAKLLDPKLHGQLPPEVLRYSQRMICSGLHWVFGLMLLAAVLQMIMSRFMPRHQQTLASPTSAASATQIAESEVLESEV